MSQIAGKTGRYRNDGGFGTTDGSDTHNSDEIEKLKNTIYRHKNYLLEKF